MVQTMGGLTGKVSMYGAANADLIYETQADLGALGGEF